MLVTKTLSQIQINRFRKAINQDYPDFLIKSIKPLKSGWDNFVVEINKSYIFRFPKSKDFDLNKEIKILNILKGEVSLKIPVYEFIGKKIPYVGYQKIAGKPLGQNTLKNLSPNTRNKLASDIAKFFFEFHQALPLSQYKKFNLKKDTQSWRPPVIEKKIIGQLKDRTLSDFIDGVVRQHLSSSKRNSWVIAYNDLHGANMAFDNNVGRLNGIFDFSDVSVEDVNREFCSLLSLDYNLAISVIRKYEKLSKRKIDLQRVFSYAVICEASVLAVFISKPKSKNYRYALNDLKQLKKISKII